MRPSVRATGVAACALLSAITLAASGSLPVAGGVATWHGPTASGAATQPPAQEGNLAGTASVGLAKPATPPAGALPADQAIRELAEGNPKPPVMAFDPTGRLLAITAQPDTALTGPGGGSGADPFVGRYAAAFGLTSAYGVKRGGEARLPGGDTVVRYQQQAAGVPVIGGELVVTVDRRGGVRSTVAETSSVSPTATAAKVDARTASATALAEAARLAGVDAATFVVSESDLWLYDPLLIGAPGRAEVRPTWWVKVAAADGADGADAFSILVDALDGSVSLALSEHREARNRIVCDLANQRKNLNYSSQYACTSTSSLGLQATTRKEGGAASSEPEVNRAYDYLGATYEFYQNRFGRDSFDDRGAQIRATVRACHLTPTPCPFPNAFWEGSQFVFGDGFVTDDVAAHEYTHAVIDHSSQLFYAYESGALNEAIADIMGEFLDWSFAVPGEDTRPWLIGEDLPGGEIRDMANPERLGQPATVGGTYWYSGSSDNGGVHTNSGPANRLAYLIATSPVGVGKSEQLWYRTTLQLPSTADYRTLGRTIYSTCLQLIGQYGFVQDDCGRVEVAVRAIGVSIRDLVPRRPAIPRPGPAVPRR